MAESLQMLQQYAVQSARHIHRLRYINGMMLQLLVGGQSAQLRELKADVVNRCRRRRSTQEHWPLQVSDEYGGRVSPILMKAILDLLC